MAAAKRVTGFHSITRRKGQFRTIEPVPMWHVELTGFGVHFLRDEEGRDPLKHPDPLERLRNIHLAASAPTLKEALILLLQRFESLHDGWHRDDELCALAWTAIYESRPVYADECKLAKENGQYHIDLDDAA